jgi:hypothetical protein
LQATHGTGLSFAALLALLSSSTAVFLFWDGPLWSAPTGASHAGRIAISYAIVVPLAALALRLKKQLSLAHLATATALVWAVKLLVTSSLYFVLAPGATREYEPVAAWEAAPRPREASVKYRSAVDGAPGVAVSGRIEADEPALVFIERPPPGRPLPAARTVALTIADARYDRAIYAAAARDRLSVENRDPELHTLRSSLAGAARGNIPLPASSVRELPVPAQPGIYALACENHPTERASLAVFDHPYFAKTDDRGAFTIADVPAGTMTLRVLAGGRAHSQPITVGASALVIPVIDLSEDAG